MKTIKDHFGKEYRSISEMCRAYSIDRTTYQKRVKSGWNQCEALCTPSKNQDLSGKDFNFLHVIERTNDNENGNKRKWKCRCKCGKIVYVSTDKIISETTKSCGCMKDDIIFKSLRNPNSGKSTKGVTYRKSSGKYESRIMRNKKSYHLGIFDYEKEAQAIYNVANSFIDMKDFEQWLLNKKYYFYEFEKICISNGIDMLRMTDAIFHSFDEKLYLNLDELKKYIEEFAESYSD